MSVCEGMAIVRVWPCASVKVDTRGTGDRGRFTLKRVGILLLGRLAVDRRRDKTRLTRKLTVISLHLFTLTQAR